MYLHSLNSKDLSIPVLISVTDATKNLCCSPNVTSPLPPHSACFLTGCSTRFGYPIEALTNVLLVKARVQPVTRKPNWPHTSKSGTGDFYERSRRDEGKLSPL